MIEKTEDECLYNDGILNHRLGKINKEVMISELKKVRESFYDGVFAINEKYSKTLKGVKVGYVQEVGIIFNIDEDDLKIEVDSRIRIKIFDTGDDITIDGPIEIYRPGSASSIQSTSEDLLKALELYYKE